MAARSPKSPVIMKPHFGIDELLDLPDACILAPTQDCLVNDRVLFNLVRPRDKDVHQVESVEGIVNVIPRGRIYRMQSLEDFDLFRDELLKRPLVLQPLIEMNTYLHHILKSIHCTSSHVQEPWLLLVNQMHPRILSRLQIGCDMVRAAMMKGIPVTLEFDFGDVISSVYHTLLRKTTHLQDLGKEELVILDAKIIIWSPGVLAYGGGVGMMSVISHCHTFKFEDLTQMNFKLRTRADAVMYVGADGRTRGSESNLSNLSECLPGWQFSLDTENMPRTRYSYASGGRLIFNLMKSTSRDRLEDIEDVDEASV